MKHVVHCTIIFIFTFIFYSSAAQDTIVISNNNSNAFIGKSATIFQDKKRLYGFGQIRHLNDSFKKSTTEAIAFGVNDYNNWAKIILRNETDKQDFAVNISNAQIDSIAFYCIKLEKLDSIFYTNNANLNTRLINHPNFIFKIKIYKGETVECFFKICSNKQINVPIQVFSAEELPIALANSDTLSGLYLGIMLAMILYNFFLYISAKDKHYLFYCHYIFWVAFTQAVLSGFAHKISFFENLFLMPKLLTFVGALSGIATIIFVLSFLRIKAIVPKLYNILIAIILGDCLALILLFADLNLLAYNVVNLTAGLGSFIVLYVAFIVHKKNYKPARFFLLGWTFFLGSVIVYVLKDVGILPYNIFTVRSVQMGSVIEAMLLSFALADKLNILKKEKETSQLQALKAAQENEKIIKEQNVVLEQKVEERTHELIVKNEDLNSTLENLKQAQSQLVEAEKMASLGQLTAGIAHEINNPINFVTSNVMPLKRDVGMLLDTIDFMEQISLSDSSVAEKTSKIETFKEELDYDYLKIEIEHLLKGIHEGSSRTAEIVKGLRIFSRVDENDLKRADVNEGIDSTLIIVNNQLNSTIQVNKEYTSPMPLIECYAGKLNQVFLNIISNAIHAIRLKHGSNATGIITIRTKVFEQFITIEFLDNGMGMNEETQHKIYEPFYTTKDVGEGTGLGMSIAFNAIKKHNGSIKLVSKLGEGSSFIIQLPIIHTIAEQQLL